MSARKRLPPTPVLETERLTLRPIRAEIDLWPDSVVWLLTREDWLAHRKERS
jgi:hypothetical protein